MEFESSIYVAGHTGLVGSAIVRKLIALGFRNLILETNLDLRNQAKVAAFFKEQEPEYVFLAAARVGGIEANSTRPGEFIYDNLQIQSNIIHSSMVHRCVKKLLFLGSNCFYPRECPQPMKEEHLLTGPLEPTNEAYAIAKIAGLKMCQAYNLQYGTSFIGAVPASIYGPGDHFDSQRAHVIASLIAKFHEAKLKGSASVTIWGTGQARREFIFVDDCAYALIYLMCNFYPTRQNNVSGNFFVNVGTGHGISTKELAGLVAKTVGFTGEIICDPTKPEGMPQKLLDSSKIWSFGWRHEVELKEGLALVYNLYQKRPETLRS